METRSEEFFTKKVEQIDRKIEECFISLEDDVIPHLKKYLMDDKTLSVQAEYVGTSEMCFSIRKLEELREFYINKLNEISNPIERLISEKLYNKSFVEKIKENIRL